MGQGFVVGLVTELGNGFLWIMNGHHAMGSASGVRACGWSDEGWERRMEVHGGWRHLMG